MKDLLIVNKAQFGYHIDSFKYCEYLASDYKISYLCFDFGQPKINHEKIRIIYIPRTGNKVVGYLRFVKAVNTELRSNKYDVVFLVYFIAAAYVLLANPSQTFNVDIRTGYDTRNKYKNLVMDYLMRAECLLFKSISIVSDSLGKSFKLKNYHVLPLGGESFSQNLKTFNTIHLLYVGTLENRNLIECVKGFHKYIATTLNHPPITFTIIGNSPGNELQVISEYIHNNNLGPFIQTKGYVQNNNLHRFFEDANIGVCFVPQTSYYDNQPPTKTYEYLLSGLPVLATKTRENIRIINEKNGLLVEDNSAAFAAGLAKIIEKSGSFDSEYIRSCCKENLWKNIVETNLKPFLSGLSDTSLPAHCAKYDYYPKN